MLFSLPVKQRMWLILQNVEAFGKCFEMQCLFVLPFKFPNDVFLKLELKSSFIWGHILQRIYFELQEKLVQNLKHHIELGYKRMCSVSKWSRIVFVFIYSDKYFIIFSDPVVIELLTMVVQHWLFKNKKIIKCIIIISSDLVLLLATKNYLWSCREILRPKARGPQISHNGILITVN